MVKYKSVKFNFIMNFILTLSNFIFPLITFPYVSRILQASGLGKVGFATSIIAYFSMIAMMGIPTYGIKACAKIRDDSYKLTKTVYELLILNTIFLAFSLTLLLLSVIFINKFYIDKELYIILAFSMLFNVLGIEWLYKALEQYSYITIRSIFFKIASLILLFVFVKESNDILPYAMLTVLASVGAGILNFYNLRKIITLYKITFKQLEITKHIKPSFTFFLLTISITIYVNLDSIMLGFMTSDDNVGYYSAAVKIKQILVTLVTSLGAVMLPRLAFYYEQKRFDEFKDLVKNALGFILIVSLPLTIYFTLYAKDAILLLSGESFLASVEPMQIIMPTVFLIALSNLMGWQILVPMDREKQIVFSTIIGAIVGGIINIFAIPYLGVNGAAIANLCAECAVVVVQIILLRKFIFPILAKINIWKMLIALFISTGVTLLIPFNSNEIINLLLSSILFFGSYLISLLILKEPMVYQIFSSVLNKIKLKRNAL
ncbi:flippase [Haemophilus haemolyticus]|nr:MULTISPECIES: flippase [Haemophilus]RDE66824.1 flippase [Haemophilus haemolyticus]TPH05411.1 flippase [Haemophilus haemolyticus]TPH25881.1 flippase [Haemophilus haemolyticus]